jgi:hypothetical protein
MGELLGAVRLLGPSRSALVALAGVGVAASVVLVDFFSWRVELTRLIAYALWFGVPLVVGLGLRLGSRPR